MSTLFLIRHGQSMGNMTGNYSTNQHDNLSEKGKIQALMLSQKLAEIVPLNSIGPIFSSPLGRAKQTISPYLKERNLSAEIWPDLAECCWQEDHNQFLSDPELPFHPFPLDRGEKKYFNCGKNREPMAPSELETYGDGIRRMKRVCHRLTDLCSKEKGVILVVCHAFCISKLSVLLTGSGDLDSSLELENTSITRFDYREASGLFSPTRT